MAPLDGIRILDLTRLLPGAYATLLLADLGADVVKLEDPRGGDGMRRLADSARSSPDDAPWFELLNRNKRSATLDLRATQAAAVVDALADWADVFVDSFRPSTARRLGVDGETLRARHPRLICASITGFGVSGPYVDRAAHDINYQSLAGLLAHEPRMPGPLIADIGSAMHAALGIVAALFERSRTAQGSVMNVSIHEAALAWSMFPTTPDLAGPCYMLYETADGEWLALGALESKFWNAFCDCICRADLRPLQFARGEERARVLQEIQSIMRTRTRAEWLALFADVDACLTPVYTRDQTAADQHLEWRGVLAREAGVVYVTPPGMRVIPAPALGANTDEVLEAAGIDAPRRAALRQERVI